ncbi:multicopper oxidase-domain-containing protein [Chlamydoabsidia padenii]|nr:multicopper oxidase-domain-containing protein [Chlamydoabsidia padenii]
MLFIYLYTLFIVVVAGKRVSFDLTISQAFIDPDCSGTAYLALLVNNQFPGPTLRVAQEDQVEIHVHNRAPVATSLHFHGIRQYGTGESDGVPGVTQHAIPPGSTFTHRFTLFDQAGTFFYHAHVGVQDDTVQGAFIVEHSPRMIEAALEYEEEEPTSDDPRGYQYIDGPYGYHDELVLHLSEWWHQSASERESYLLGPDFTHDLNADSVLLNGRTVHQDHNGECQGHTVLDVLPNRTYRLRVIGGNTFRTFGLGIKDHNMTIIEVDGEMVYPYTTTHLEITPGQRFSVLIHTDQTSDSLFTIATSYLHRNRGSGYTENGFGYLRYLDPTSMLNKRDVNMQKRTVSHKSEYHEPPPIIHTGFPEIPQVVPRDWIWPELRPLFPADPEFRLDQAADRTLKIRTWTAILPDGSTRYLVNGKVFRHASDDFTLAMVGSTHQIEADGFEPTMGTYPIQLNETVDLVFQNGQSGHQCLLHPWHTHGHSHYVIASGDGEYVHERDQHKRNFPHPIYKDVSTVYATKPDPVTKGCGWTKVRIYADNPGVWAVHCHITAHMLQGKMIVLEEASDWIESYRLYP